MSIAELTNHVSEVAAEPPILERLLRHREGIWRQVRTEAALDHLLWRLLRTATLSLAGYGAVLGIGHPAWLLQVVASALKLPLLYLLTLAICLPTLYLFNLLYGGRLSLRQVITLALAAITVMAGLTVAFAPISVLFLVSARDYGTYKLLNVGILGFTGLTGLGYLVEGMRRMNQAESNDGVPMTDPAVAGTAASGRDRPATASQAGVTMPLLLSWLVLFAVVGTQLAWTLSPFFGDPELPFILFRPTNGNFYADVVMTLQHQVRLTR